MAPWGVFSVLLGSLITTVNGVQDVAQMPELWCITYLSTYLAPVSAPPPDSVPETSGFMSEGSFVTLTNSQTLELSSLLPEPEATSPSTLRLPSGDETSDAPTAPATSAAGISPDGELVIFRVVPDTSDTKRGLQKRGIGGFVGAQSEDCNDAAIFILVEGQLLDGPTPVYYDGEAFKELGGQLGEIPSGAITKTFSRNADNLRFADSALPNGQAGFCQDQADNRVYLTFSTVPDDCVPVRLVVINAQECQDGIISPSTAISSKSEQQPSTSLGPQFPSLSSSDPDPSMFTEPERETDPVIETDVVIETQSNSIPFTNGIQPQPLPTTTVRWSNISSSLKPPSLSTKTSQAALASMSTSLFPMSSEPSTLIEPLFPTSSIEVVLEELSTALYTETIISESATEPGAPLESTMATQSASTIVTDNAFKTETQSNSDTDADLTSVPTTDGSFTSTTGTDTSVETGTDTSVETGTESSIETSTDLRSDTTTDTLSASSTGESIPIVVGTESNSETSTDFTSDPATDTGFTSTTETDIAFETESESSSETSTDLIIDSNTSETETTIGSSTDALTDSTTETSMDFPDDTTTTFVSSIETTTTEPATTTTEEVPLPLITCPSNPAQCIRTFSIECNVIIIGVPYIAARTVDECARRCILDPTCILFTHFGDSCYIADNDNVRNNRGGAAGWTSGIRDTCGP